MNRPAFGVALMLAMATRGLAAEPPLKIVALGDSITRGVRSGVKQEETFAALLEKDLRAQGAHVTVVNVGIGGERTDGALARLDKVLEHKPKVVTIMYGTNDSHVDKGTTKSRLSVEQYENNLRELLERITKAGAVPVLMTSPRWGDNAKDGLGENPNGRLEPYVAACRKMAKETRTPLVDHYAHWSKAAAGGTDVGTVWTTDECHPNPRGHRELADRILPILRPLVGGAKK